MAAYEDYPMTRYGMDSIFYWTRIWLVLDKEKKDEIDAVWCLADGFLTLSATAYLGAALWIAIGLTNHIEVISHLGRSGFDLLECTFVSASLVIIGYLSYRLSVSRSRMNGELIKAIFDLYRDKITVMFRLGPAERKRWKGAWAYLQYQKVSCASYGEYYSADEEKCAKCGSLRDKSLEALGLVTTGVTTVPKSTYFCQSWRVESL